MKLILQDLLNLKSDFLQSKNQALRDGAKTDFFYEGEHRLAQIKFDFVERAMKVKGFSRLGFNKQELEDITEEKIRKKLEELFPGKSEAIIDAFSQLPIGLVPFTLDQGLACTHSPEKSLAILQPKPEDIDIDLIFDTAHSSNIILECKYEKFVVANLDDNSEDYLNSPVKTVFKLTQKGQAWGFEFEELTTENKLFIEMFKDKICSDEEILFNTLQTANSLLASMVLISAEEAQARNGNGNPRVQFERDVRMVKGAIEQPGDESAALVLKKLYTLLYFGDLFYKREQKWHLWRENKDNVPIASALCHGSRTLIQFPVSLSDEIMSWLLNNNSDREKYTRLAATHGVEGLKVSEEVNDSIIKVIYESKKGIIEAGRDTLRNYISSTNLKHYGINVALGGNGLINEISSNQIACNGEHGHLYMCYNEPTKINPDDISSPSYAGLLISFEQSAPGSNGDQYGGIHGISGAHLNYTATGGDDFARPPKEAPADYQGLRGIGPDTYYDGLFLNLTQTQFEKIKILAQSFDFQWLQKLGEKLEPSMKAQISQTEPDSLITDVEEQLKFRELSAKNKELLQFRDELNKEIEQLNQNYQQILQKTTKLQESETTITENIQIFVRHYEAVEQEYHSLVEKEKILAESYKSLERKINQAREQKDAHLREKLKAQQPIEQAKLDLQIDSKKLQDEKSIFEKEKQAFEEEKERLKKDILTLNLEREDLNQKNQELETSSQQLEGSQQSLNNGQDRLSEERANLIQGQEAIAKRQAELNQLQEALQQSQARQLEENQKSDEIRAADPPIVMPLRARISKFLQQHWGKILLGSLIGVALVGAGVLTMCIVPIIASALGVSILATGAIGLCSAATLGAIIGGSAAAGGAAPIPTKQKSGVKSSVEPRSILTAAVDGNMAASVGTSVTAATDIGTVPTSTATVDSTAGIIIGTSADNKDGNISKKNSLRPQRKENLGNSTVVQHTHRQQLFTKSHQFLNPDAILNPDRTRKIVVSQRKNKK